MKRIEEERERNKKEAVKAYKTIMINNSNSSSKRRGKETHECKISGKGFDETEVEEKGDGLFILPPKSTSAKNTKKRGDRSMECCHSLSLRKETQQGERRKKNTESWERSTTH